MDIIWFLCWAYLVLSVFALLYTYFFQRSESQLILRMICTYFIFGLCMLLVNILFALFASKPIFVLDILPVYLIVLALLNLIFSFGSISHPAGRGLARLSSIISNGNPIGFVAYILLRLSLLSGLLLFYQGSFLMITHLFVSANRGVVAILIIFAEMLLIAVCFVIVGKRILRRRT